MYISDVRQNYAATAISRGNTLPVSNLVAGSNSASEPVSPSRTIDMSNVSLNEINELIKSGVDGLLDVVPFVSPQILNEGGAAYAANIKVDYIGQIQDAISYQESIGRKTEFLERVLDNVKKIDGLKVPNNIYVVA